MPTVRIGFDEVAGLPSLGQLVQYGPTLPVRIGFDQEHNLASPGPPNLPDHVYPALVDTGATISCIDSALALHLGLPIVNRRMIAGVHGASTVNIHLAQIYIPSLEFTDYGEFAGVHLAAGGQPYFALLGRTFLLDFTMTYEGRTGVVTISND